MPEHSLQAIFDTDSPHEECGVLAISSTQDDAAQLSFFGLFAMKAGIQTFSKAVNSGNN